MVCVYRFYALFFITRQDKYKYTSRKEPAGENKRRKYGCDDTITTGCFLRVFYTETVNNFLQILYSKIYDINIVKSSACSPFKRECLVLNVHRLVFTIIGARFLPNEISLVAEKSIESKIDSITRFLTVFNKANIIRFQKTGDLTLCAPWGALTQDLNTTLALPDETMCHDTIDQGSYIVVIEKDEEKMKVFIPSGGPDPDTDMVKQWVTDVKINRICVDIDMDKIPTIKSEGISSTIKVGEDWFIALRSNDLQEGDYVIFKKERMQVYAVSVDFNSDYNNVIRCTKSFKYNHTAQSFKMIKIPSLQGKIVSVDVDKVIITIPIEVKLSNINKHSIGTASIRYYNFCFNAMGFLTHDTAE